MLQGANTNASALPTGMVSFFLGNPGGFAVSGKAVGAQQVSISDPTSPISAMNVPSNMSSSISIDFIYANGGSTQTLQTNAPFTCTFYDNSTLLGTATATVPSTQGAECYAYSSPATPPQAYSNRATLNIPNALYSGHVYTEIISQ